MTQTITPDEVLARVGSAAEAVDQVAQLLARMDGDDLTPGVERALVQLVRRLVDAAGEPEEVTPAMQAGDELTPARVVALLANVADTVGGLGLALALRELRLPDWARDKALEQISYCERATATARTALETIR